MSPLAAPSSSSSSSPSSPVARGADMLETSPQNRQQLEARLRIARAPVSLQGCEFNTCHQAGWLHYAAAWLRRGD